MLGRIGELVRVVTQVLQLIGSRSKVALLNGVRGTLAGRNVAQCLSEAVEGGAF